ncbi:MAG TPA: hypothetical protein P5257_05750 [Bacteroidales bacterium]|nr:hypothetical protein [Bacteroidales bacterium]HRR94071.1 hypothetical protein [Bacteroidales bacterium]HRT89607.1 hypothetical protein [Bacteroidales bacterium]
MKSKIDNTVSGFVLGIVLPAATLAVLYLVTSGGVPFFQYITDIVSSGKVTRVVSLCVIPVVILFFIFNRLDMLRGAKGLLAATFFWVLVILVERIF